jgi:hypothetical protein
MRRLVSLKRVVEFRKSEVNIRRVNRRRWQYRVRIPDREKGSVMPQDQNPHDIVNGREPKMMAKALPIHAAGLMLAGRRKIPP